MFGAAVLLVGGLAVLAYLVTHEKEKGEESAAARIFPLVRGKRYAILYSFGPVFQDASELEMMFVSMGFCDVEQVQPLPGQLQMIAKWCNPNMNWEVPPNVAITEY